MTESFMTTEGDRSGVHTPSRDEKARVQLQASITETKGLDFHWSNLTRDEKLEVLDTLRVRLERIATHLRAGE